MEQLQDQIKDMEAALAKLKAQLPKSPETYCPNCSCPSCFGKSYPGPGPFPISRTHGSFCGCLLCMTKKTNDQHSPWCHCEDCLFKLNHCYNHGGMCACSECVKKAYL